MGDISISAGVFFFILIGMYWFLFGTSKEDSLLKRLKDSIRLGDIHSKGIDSVYCGFQWVFTTWIITGFILKSLERYLSLKISLNVVFFLMLAPVLIGALIAERRNKKDSS